MGDETWIGWVLIAGMGILAFLSRAIFVLPGSHLRLPAMVERALRYAPAAALMAIIVPDLASSHGAVAISIGNPRLVAGLVAFALAATTRSIVATIAGGMAVLLFLH